MRVAVIGAGAVGLGLGSCLLEAGATVRFIARSPERRCALKTDGLRRSGIFGDAHYPAESFELSASVESLRKAQLDAILVCTKSPDSAAVARALHAIWPSLEGPAAVILCQNGWGNAEIFADCIPRENVFNARVITGFRCPAPNAVEITVHAEPVRVGSLFTRDASDPRIDALCSAIAEGGLPCESVLEIERDLWAKMLYNCALNPLGALLGVPYGALGAAEESRAVLEAVVREIFEVLERTRRRTHWASAADYLRDLYAKLLPATGRHESSMLQDLRAGRATEIEALCGAVVNLGEQHDVATPVNHALRELILAIENR